MSKRCSSKLDFTSLRASPDSATRAASTIRPPSDRLPSESRDEFETAAALLTGDEGAEAAPVLAGLGQAELMSGSDAAAERRCAQVFELLPSAADNPAAWAMARRVLGIVRSNQGDPDEAVMLCRESVAVAGSVQARAMATLYLCVALLDAGDDAAVISTALDAVADGQLTGLDGGFGGYFDALAAEALIRAGAVEP